MGKLLIFLILAGGGAAFAMGVRVYPLHLADYVPRPKGPTHYVAEMKDGTSVTGKLIYRDEELVIINDGTRDIDLKTAGLKSVDEDRPEDSEVVKPKRKLYSYDPELSLFKKFMGESPEIKLPGATLAESYTSETQSKIGQGEHLKNRVKKLI